MTMKALSLTDAEFEHVAALVDDVRKKNAGARPLFAKLTKVMGDLQRIPKRGWNDFHKYAYVTDEDVMDAVRPVFAKHGVGWFPTLAEETQEVRETKRGKTNYTRVKLKALFVDPETGDQAESEWIGTATDDGDKGLYKAITGAVKYCLTTTMMLSSGDDPEKMTKDEQTTVAATKDVDPDERKKNMLGAFASIGVTEAMIKRKFGREIGDLTEGDYEELGLAFRSIAKSPKARDEFFGKPAVSQVDKLREAMG